ncbi:MAG: alpha/beta hydrolase family protein [Janthinobacterium lividum]
MNSKGYVLDARLDVPQGSPKAYAIYVHCFTCTKEIHIAHRISLFLTNHQIAVLRFDFTGLGGSQGNFAESNFTSNVDDIKSAAQFLRENYQPAQLIIGHSLGGTAALVATQQLNEIRAVVTLNSPYHPSHVMHHFEAEKMKILNEGQSDISVDGRTFQLKKQFLDDLKSYDMTSILPHLNAALLIMHAPEDDIVSIQNASSIFAMAKHPKSFICLDQTDHLISRLDNAQYVANLIYQWVFKYLE